MIQAIIFDFYGVISSDELRDSIGIEAYEESTMKQLIDDINLGRIDWEEYCQQISSVTHRSLEEVNEMFKSYQINRQVVGLIGKLKAEFKIGLLTNANHGHIDSLLNNVGVRQDFDAVVVSADVGLVKPQPGIYQAICKELDVEPEECIFIDDSALNVDGAQAVGMHGIVYQNFPQLRKELEVLLAE